MSKIRYTVDAEPEDTPVRGNACASGDDKHDEECEAHIRSELSKGNVWAWASVEVRAYAADGNIFGSSFMGCCSYESEADFKKCEYFIDMKAEALDNLEINIEKEAEKVRKAKEELADEILRERRERRKAAGK